MTEENWRRLDLLNEFCAARRRSILEAAFAWLLSNPFIGSVIAGATTPEQVEANVKAGDWSLSPDDYKELDRILG